ncbi:MAG TPA: Crp/Fnr family transcriptional regulator [Bacteroidales bacterium]|nr:Crp/Fnr family transcriptional regulator [Bacteroidales bacterium]
MPDSNLNLNKCLNGEKSVFKTLSQKEKELLAKNHSVSSVKNGTFLFSEGDKLNGLIFLISGKVKEFKKGPGGREQILRMPVENGLIGFESLFTDVPCTVSAMVIEDSEIVFFEREAILKIIRKNPELSFGLLKILADDINISDNRIVSLTQKHVRGRIAEALLLLSEIYGFESDGKTINISLSRQDIANLANMTTSNAIRTLSTFASEGNIALNGKKISILDSGKLEQISRSC